MLEARLMVAASTLKMIGTDALADAAERWIAWAEQTAPRRAYKADKAAYDAGRSHSSPDPRDYGLPVDYGHTPATRP